MIFAVHICVWLGPKIKLIENLRLQQDFFPTTGDALKTSLPLWNKFQSLMGKLNGK